MKKLSLLAALAFAFSTASAGTITFDSLEQAGQNWALQGQQYVENGFNIAVGKELLVPQQSNYFYNTSAAGIINYFTDAATLTKVDGSTFSLVSIDLAVMRDWNGQTVVFDGIKQGGATVTQSFVVNQNQFTTFNFNAGDFSGLTSLTWHQGAVGQAHIFDNIGFVSQAANDVPEPLSATLLGIGLVGLAASRRKSAAARAI